MANRFVRNLCFTAISVALVPAALAAKPPPPSPIPLEYGKAPNTALPRHTGNYQPLRVQWRLNQQLHDVLAVFPDPLAAERIYLATNDGLLRSTDSGKTFAPLPQATAEKIGVVSGVAFQPNEPSRLLIATRGHGIWSSKDGGDTVTSLADKTKGLAGDEVQNVYFSPDDKRFHTIIAAHGAEATGLSRSVDGGKTWEVLFRDQHVLQAFWIDGAGKQMLLECSPEKDPEARAVYYTPSLQEPWQKLLTDTVVTGIAIPQGMHDGTVFLATADKGLFRIARAGGIIRNVGPADPIEWSSFGIAWGPTADSQIIYGYDAKKLGLVMFTANDLLGGVDDSETTQPADGNVPYRTQSDGLFTGPLVLDGSHIRASANARAFFAVVNRTLYQTTLLTDSLCVTDVSVQPSAIVIDIAKVADAQSQVQAHLTAFATSHQVAIAAKTLLPKIEEANKALSAQRFTVSAKVASQKSDPPTSVTVDLSRLDQSASAPLYDDGNHGDGAADDGIYANSFSINFATIRPRNPDWRQTWPGTMQLTVSAITERQTLAGAVGALSLFNKVESLPFLANDAYLSKLSGNVAGKAVRLGTTKRAAQQISVRGAGDWSMALWSRRTVDIGGQQVLSFMIRASKPTDSEIVLQLRDTPTYSRTTLTQPINLLAEGYIPNKKLTTGEVRVAIPVSRILKDAGDFQTSIVGAMVFSGVGKEQVDILIRDIEFLPDAEMQADDESEGAK